MARINTNVASLVAQTNLARTSGELNLRLERLSTGLKINRGKDDPAGLIISERIRSDLQGINQGINNAQRASSVVTRTSPPPSPARSTTTARPPPPAPSSPP